MGTIDLSIKDEASPFIQSKVDDFIPQAITMMDDIADIYKQGLEDNAPIGETGELGDLSTWDSIGTLERFIFSASDHFDPIVKGHTILGPYTSDKQLRWWFWYLWNELGGSYEPKYGTGNKTEANDYPAIAFEDADSAIDDRVDEFAGWVVE